MKHTLAELEYLRSLPLREKVKLTRERIREWYEHWNGMVYVSYSGGKDSTVLLHMVRQMYPDVPAVFSNTGLEFPEVRDFAINQTGIQVIRPARTFIDIVKTEGYPIISKSVASKIRCSRKFDMDGHARNYLVDSPLVRLKNGKMAKSMYDKSHWRPLAEEAPFKLSDKCCRWMKKKPMADYEKQCGRHPIIGTMTGEGKLRERAWLVRGCNAFEGDHKISTPMAFWSEQDVLTYIHDLHVPIATIYGQVVPVGGKECEECKYRTTGAERTGCAFCAFGAHLEKKHRYLQMAETHPKLYHYCIEGGEWVDNPDYDPDIPVYANDGFKNWNPRRIWQPSSKGLGLGFVFEFINRLYKREMIPYKTDFLGQIALTEIGNNLEGFDFD